MSNEQQEPTLDQIIKFLLGEGEIDHLSFGERPSERHGPYWWRKPLRAAWNSWQARANLEADAEPVCIIKEDGLHWSDAFIQSVAENTLVYAHPDPNLAKLQAENEAMKKKLKECRSSVAYDFLAMRRVEGNFAEWTDTAKAVSADVTRLSDLLDYIDAIAEQTKK